MQIFPTPSIHPFERLQVSEGLLITTERWQQTQRYHRQRQNFQFQALYQPGIVCGLGVSIISRNADDNIRYQDTKKLLQIQPGIAIDANGNPIIVPKPEVFQLRSTPTEAEVVYLVVNYVDPDELRSPPEQNSIQETFRIIEKNALAPEDVELCRILFDGTDISLAADPYFPEPNTLDHRHRLPIRQRPQTTLQVAQIVAEQPDQVSSKSVQKSLRRLLESVDSLLPTLQGDTDIHRIDRTSLAGIDHRPYDLIYCDYEQLPHLAAAALPRLKNYLETGGLLCINTDIASTRLNELYTVRQELLVALDDLGDFTDTDTMQQQLLSEVDATETEIASSIREICQSVFDLTLQIDYPLTGRGKIDSDHPLLTYPFLFGQLPTLKARPIHGFCWGGIVLLISNLPQAWRADPALKLSRNTIRAAQELGINLMHYGWRRRQLTQLQKSQRPGTPPPVSPSLTRQVTPAV
ncbi:hypothetical protein [Leptothoe spongobia]|uniref:DUF4159 domain-containing protein n=1 Tax=Leptothoe spongobia TAU-MAC 1115 TaxID=1967444 RepID=A0A947GPQ8_9CYAN|nr:hypothetical protein [Leptothoe spongobia]MBT9316676.1 hypothetical protein [Leptothoe spongobia TAU-MAC 1115]